jgi:hypothetical protein
MDQVFVIPGSKRNKWIETNGLRTKLSEIKIENGLC